MSRPLVVVGAGGFGRETIDIIHALRPSTTPFTLLGVVDDSPSDTNLRRLEERDLRYLGTTADILQTHAPAYFTPAVGNPGLRRTLALRFEEHLWEPATIIHPRATLAADANVAKGAVVCANAYVSTNASIGPYAHVNAASTIGHDTVVHSYVSVNPGAVISGDCCVHDGALIGANATVLQGLTVGSSSLVAAGACVTRHVAEHTTVRGVPAK